MKAGYDPQPPSRQPVGWYISPLLQGEIRLIVTEEETPGDVSPSLRLLFRCCSSERSATHMSSREPEGAIAAVHGRTMTGAWIAGTAPHWKTGHSASLSAAPGN